MEDQKVNEKVCNQISEALNDLGIFHETLKLRCHPEFYLVSELKAPTIAAELFSAIESPVTLEAIDEDQFMVEIRRNFYTFFVFDSVEEMHDYQKVVYNWQKDIKTQKEKAQNVRSVD